MQHHNQVCRVCSSPNALIMKNTCLLAIFLIFTVVSANGQSRRVSTDGYYGNDNESSYGNGTSRHGTPSDSIGGTHKEIPKGIHEWTVDRRFGDILKQPMDTLTHMFQNTFFTSGMRGEYNYTGNTGTPRINRIFIDRQKDDGQFLFTQPYDFFHKQPDEFRFTNTLSPYTNLGYNTCGNRTNGEDHFTAKFAVNAGKHLGVGFNINYHYGRGYYSEQSTSLLGINLYGSYIGDQYQAHLLLTSNRQKITENGGITEDTYITNPESYDDNFATSEIPTVLSSNWNRNSSNHVFLTHRYNIGFHRKVKMSDEEIAAKRFALESAKDNPDKDKDKKNRGNDDVDENGNKITYAGRPDNAKVVESAPLPADSLMADSGRVKMDLATADSIISNKTKEQPDTSWMKTEYVPVTSFIHTAQLDSHDRIYQSHATPTNYYGNTYYNYDSSNESEIYDETKFLRLRNTFAISLLEGFNKWMFAGLKVFAASDLRRYALPDESNNLVNYTDHNFSIGGQMSRTQGKAFHYNVTAETWLLGDDQGQVKVDASAELNFPFLGDTVSLAAKGFFHNERPNYYLRHFHSSHFWWDDNLSMSTHTRIEGLLSYKKTRTSLRFGVDEITNHTYLVSTFDTDDALGRINNTVKVAQSGTPITVLTASLQQNLTLGILNWENTVTWQKSTEQSALPVPALNIYSNLYLKFRIAKVLYTELGADARYFTSYEAPDYMPAIGQFTVQGNAEKTKIGNYPIVCAYANFNLKGTRFFVMYAHANKGMGNRCYFLTPHYPINGSVLRLGISWNFYN